MSSHRLQGSQQGHQKIYMAHAQSRGYILQTEMELHTSQLWIFAQDTITSLLDKSSIPKTAFNFSFQKI